MSIHQNQAASSISALSISELNQRIATLIERSVPKLWVEGEISNLKQYPSGHWYFSLKDEHAQVRAVMFRPKVAQLKWQPREGEAVQAYVGASLYTARGDFQLTVESMRPRGLGSLYEQFAQLKLSLAEQGLFDPKNKQALPSFVQHIGIITSPQTAALRDVAHTLARRAPHIQAWVYPCLVQGVSAAAQIARAIELANQNAKLQALLIIRGGGSIEDLWSFNEPQVAHAIHKSHLPTVCGVGHETDTTIADYVADIRAATPTAAAELISSPTDGDWHAAILHRWQNVQRQLQRAIERNTQRLDYASARLLTPAQRLRQQQQYLTQLAHRLTNTQRQHSTQAHRQLQFLTQRLDAIRPNSRHLELRQQHLLNWHNRLNKSLIHQIERQNNRIHTYTQHLKQLNPKNVLNRGYAYVHTQNEDIVYNANSLHAGDGITIQLSQGRVIATVNHTESDTRGD